ncbi:hypothetical protein J6590_066253 [Homalodisca vitripennis]|nr:hypothetical protein J6590_066253 [Homalodisca vitripennis]
MFRHKETNNEQKEVTKGKKRVQTYPKAVWSPVQALSLHRMQVTSTNHKYEDHNHTSHQHRVKWDTNKNGVVGSFIGTAWNDSTCIKWSEESVWSGQTLQIRDLLFPHNELIPMVGSSGNLTQIRDVELPLAARHRLSSQTQSSAADGRERPLGHMVGLRCPQDLFTDAVREWFSSTSCVAFCGVAPMKCEVSGVTVVHIGGTCCLLPHQRLQVRLKVNINIPQYTSPSGENRNQHRMARLRKKRVQRLSQDNQIKVRRAWLLLGWVTAGDPVLASSQPAQPFIGGGSEVTFKPLVPRLSFKEGFLALTSPAKIKHIYLLYHTFQTQSFQ